MVVPAMAQPLSITDQILDVVRHTPECRFDDVVLTCRDFSWRAVLIEVSRLSRDGQLQVMVKSMGIFTLRLVERESPVGAYESAGHVR